MLNAVISKVLNSNPFKSIQINSNATIIHPNSAPQPHHALRLANRLELNHAAHSSVIYHEANDDQGNPCLEDKSEDFEPGQPENYLQPFLFSLSCLFDCLGGNYMPPLCACDMHCSLTIA